MQQKMHMNDNTNEKIAPRIPRTRSPCSARPLFPSPTSLLQTKNRIQIGLYRQQRDFGTEDVGAIDEDLVM